MLKESNKCNDDKKCDAVWDSHNLLSQKCAVKIVQDLCPKRCGLCNCEYNQIDNQP